MRILIGLTYYRPHTSGLTIYAERLANGLAARGHEVTVLTSWYDRTVPREQTSDGVRVLRVPVFCRVSKGVVMPTFGSAATRMVREHDVVNLHLPQFDAAGVALRGRVMRRPTVLTYQSDLMLPPGPFNRVANRVVDAANWIAAKAAHAIVATTRDFAEHSPLLRRFAQKLEIIEPIVRLAAPTPEAVRAFRARHGLDGARPLIGMAARLAAEKGVEILLEALPSILREHPDAHVVFAGPHRDVFGEERYARRLDPLLRRYGDRWRFLGVLPDEEVPVFLSALDVLTVPSLNSTESFAMVQVEAMLCGTPCVTSDLPGVRQAVLRTGMGEIVPPGDGEALAAAISRVCRDRERSVRSRGDIEEAYDADRSLASYETLFARLLDQVRSERHAVGERASESAAKR